MQIRTVPTTLSLTALATRNASALLTDPAEAVHNAARNAQVEWPTTVRASAPDYDRNADAMTGWCEVAHEAAVALNVPEALRAVWCEAYEAEAEALSVGWVDMRNARDTEAMCAADHGGPDCDLDLYETGLGT